MQVQAERPLATLNAPHANKNRHNSFRRNAHGPWTRIMLFSKIDSAEATHVSVQCYTLESITEPYEDGQSRGPPAAPRLHKLLLCQATLQRKSSEWLFASPLAPNSDGQHKFRSCFFLCALEARGPPQVLLLRRWPRLPIIFAISVNPRAAHDPRPTSFFYYLFLHVFIYYVFCFCTMHDQQYPQTAPCGLINGVALTFFNLFLNLFLFFI